MEEFVPLSDYTTLRVGGPARFFAKVATVQELRERVAWARSQGISVFPLGSGSNVLVGDKGFPGLVVKVSLRGFELSSLPSGETEVSAGAGEDWDDFVGETVARGLSGLENLSYIPGSVGAAPVQNIGAYGVEVGEHISWVEALNTETLRMERLSREECSFAYRNTFFKTDDGKKLIITSVGFSFLPYPAQRLNYKDVRNYFDERKIKNPSPSAVRDAITRIRKDKLPDIRLVGTAGSFFKNPVIAQSHYDRLQKSFPLLPGFPESGGGVKIPIAWILDHVLLMRALRIGPVGLHEHQPLALVHYGGGDAKDIRNLAERIMSEVKDTTGIILEPEVVFVGNF